MSALSDYTENNILDHIVRRVNWPSPTTYLSLHIGAPTEDGSHVTSTEVSAGWYQRLSTSGKWAAASGSSISTNSLLEFASVTSQITITHVALYDSPTKGTGNLIWYKSIGSKQFSVGSVPKIDSGDLTVSITSSNMSNYLMPQILDHIVGRVPYTVESTIRASLHSADPGATGTSELVGNGYSRQNPTWNNSSNGTIDNSALINFGTASGSSWTVNYVGLWDAASGGNFILYAPVDSAPLTVGVGDDFEIPSGGFDISAA